MLFGIRWGSLRIKIIAWSFIPAAIILGGVALVTLTAYQRVTEDLVIERDQEVTRLSASQLSAELAEYANLLEVEARTVDLFGDSPSAQRDALRRASNRLAAFDAGVLVLDTFGTVVAAHPDRPEILGQGWSEHAIYQETLHAKVWGTSGPLFSDIVPDGPDGAEVVAVVVQITSPQGEFVGMLAGMFRVGATAVSAFYGEIVKLHLEGSGGAYLVDKQGRVIYHADPERIGEDVSAQPVVQQVLAGEVGAIRTQDLEGREIVASFAPIPGTSWGLVSQESWTALINPGRGYQRFLLLLLVLGVVMPALVVAVGVRRLTRPILDLIGAAQEVAEGDFGQTITAETGDEIEELAGQFNRMSAQLEASYAQLEREAADRTRELEALNAIAAVVSQSLDLDDILSDALDKTLQVMGIEAGGIYLLDEDAGLLNVAAQRGFRPEFVAEIDHLQVGEGFSGRVAESGQPLVVQDVSADPRLTRFVVQQEGLRSLAVVPLSSKGRVLGTLFAVAHAYREFSDQDVQLLTSIGHQIGIAVENVRLYERAQQLAVVEERQRLARDLHDAVTQTLFSASLIAETVPTLWELDQAEGRALLRELRQLSRGALAEMRTLLLELRPAALAESSLSDLLRQLGEAVTGRTGAPVDVRVDGPCSFPSDVHVALYRIAQEALNNVVKHAHAGRICVSLRCASSRADVDSERGQRVELAIEDDGRGFDPACIPPDRLGLSIIRERAQAIGAALQVDSRPGCGTRIVVVWFGANGREPR